MCDCKNNKNMTIKEIGDELGDVFTSVVDNFQAQATNNQAVAESNQAVAAYMLKKAQTESSSAAAVNKAINTAVTGLLVILAIYVAAKFVVPAFKK